MPVTYEKESEVLHNDNCYINDRRTNEEQIPHHLLNDPVIEQYKGDK